MCKAERAVTSPCFIQQSASFGKVLCHPGVILISTAGVTGADMTGLRGDGLNRTLTF
jgi:hypothetical protein